MTKEIKVCMGSSCFARGNADNLELIEKYIKEFNLDAKVELFGARCENECEKGPHIFVDGKKYSEITLEQVEQIMKEIVDNE